MAFRTSYNYRNLKSRGFCVSVETTSPHYHQTDKKFKEKIKLQNERFKRIQALKDVYSIYINEYLDFYKEFLRDEYVKIVSEQFPEVNFDIDIRVKSQNSYNNKIIKKLDEGYSGNIYDIFASKITIYSVENQINNQINMINDEKTLIEYAYKIADFLSSSDINQKVISLKDYIGSPKKTGYQSIHLIRKISIPNSDKSFNAETQIKTFRMREEEKFGSYSHSSVYKSNRNSTLENLFKQMYGTSEKDIDEETKKYVPRYLFINNRDNLKKCSVEEKPFFQCFKHFFNISYKQYKENLTKRIHNKEK